MGGCACRLYPVGVEVVAYDGSIIDTDTSKIRYWAGQDDVYTEEYIAYKQDDVLSVNEIENLVVDYFNENSFYHSTCSINTN